MKKYLTSKKENVITFLKEGDYFNFNDFSGVHCLLKIDFPKCIARNITTNKEITVKATRKVRKVQIVELKSTT